MEADARAASHSSTHQAAEPPTKARGAEQKARSRMANSSASSAEQWAEYYKKLAEYNEAQQ